MALWLRKGAGLVYVETIAAKKSQCTRCHSFSQKETSEQLERHGSEPVRISTLDEKQCCKFMPLTFPSKPSMMRPKGRKLKNSGPPNPSSDPDGDTADWISKVVNDPLVEVDPVTMSQHLGAHEPSRKHETAKTLHNKMSHRTRTSSLLVSTCRQPFTYFSSPPQGFGRVIVAVGATVLLASLASAVHLFRARRQLEKVVNYDSSSDEENKLDLLSLVEAQQDNQQEEEEESTEKSVDLAEEEIISLQNVSPEVVYAAAVAALAQSGEFQQAFAQQHEANKVPVHAVPDLLFQRPSSEKLTSRVEEAQVSVQSFNVTTQVEEVETTRDVQSGDEDQSFDDSPGDRVDTEEIKVQKATDDLTAPFMSSDLDDELPPPPETSEGLKKQREFLRELELLCLATFVFVFLGVPGTEQEALAGDGFTGTMTSEKGVELRKVVQAAVPAVAVGAGAMGMITGVDGALELVGLTATASFIYYDLLWADARKDLCQEFRSITDHSKLTEFLKSKKIVQPDL